MIQEDYVSFETARLLKEKGFDVPYYYCTRVYGDNGTLQGINSVRFRGVKYISAPTLQMAMKWIREVHNINIEIMTYWTKDKSMVYGNRIVHNATVLKEIDTAYNSYEEACESAIKYCLETLI